MRYLYAFILAILLAIVPMTSQAVVCGDVDGNGSKTATDALLLLQSAVGQPVQLTCEQCGPTTTTTTTLPSGIRSFSQDFLSIFGFSGTGTISAQADDSTIVFRITVDFGKQFFCNSPEVIIQNGTQFPIQNSCIGFNDSPNCMQMIWANFNSIACGDIFAGVTVTGTINSFPPTFDITQPFRLILGVFANRDFFDFGAF